MSAAGARRMRIMSVRERLGAVIEPDIRAEVATERRVQLANGRRLAGLRQRVRLARGAVPDAR